MLIKQKEGLNKQLCDDMSAKPEAAEDVMDEVHHLLSVFEKLLFRTPLVNLLHQIMSHV
jgi:hypothetical protein